MNRTVRNTGLALLAAGALAYPAMKLYRYVKQRRADSGDEPGQNGHKAFAPAYRGDSKPHRRKADTNGRVPQ